MRLDVLVVTDEMAKAAGYDSFDPYMSTRTWNVYLERVDGLLEILDMRSWNSFLKKEDDLPDIFKIEGFLYSIALISLDENHDAKFRVLYSDSNSLNYSANLMPNWPPYPLSVILPQIHAYLTTLLEDPEREGILTEDEKKRILVVGEKDCEILCKQKTEVELYGMRLLRIFPLKN